MGAFIDVFAYIFICAFADAYFVFHFAASHRLVTICAFADAYFVFLRATLVSNIVTHNSGTQ